MQAIDLYKSVCYLAMTLTILLYPMYFSYAHAQKHKIARSNIKALFNVPLIRLLTDPAYADDRNDFERVLIKEFSVENLVFFEAALRYRMEPLPAYCPLWESLSIIIPAL